MEPDDLERDESLRAAVVTKAITAADEILMSGCGGRPDLLLLLTQEVVSAYAEKVMMMLRSEMYKQQMQRVSRNGRLE